jgi:murein DD-endopeptidase MepM/ murein hydrolase activator NlpD
VSSGSRLGPIAASLIAVSLIAASLIAAGALPAQTPPAAQRLRLETVPAPAMRGRVVWLYARPTGVGDSALTLDGSAADEPLHFERLRDGRFRSLLGIPLEGGDSLILTLHLSTGAVTDTSVLALPVGHPRFVNERLMVPPQFVRLDSTTQARVDAEVAQSRVMGRRAHDTPRLWTRAFVRPRPSRITSVFGNGREFNGSVTSQHLGTDFAGRSGAPVRAANRAVVALVASFYLAGRAVYLDHGGGLMTGYFHLSRVDVATGDTVAAGQIIGGVGQSGRATGPHLHWIARYGAVTVDPLSLFPLGKPE